MSSKQDPSQTRERRDLAEVAIASVSGLAFAFIALYIVAAPATGYLAANRDFISYWAAGRQLVLHANPYDRDAVSALEHSAGVTTSAVLLMRNPPWALPFAFPLGFLNVRVASILWTTLLLAALLISVRLVRRLHGSPPNRNHWLGIAFTPALICLTMGQTSLFALLGLVLFLRFYRHRQFAAGAALWLCALKPHLFLPFFAGLLAWVIASRSYRLLAGAVAAIALSSAAAFLVWPNTWHDYFRMMRSPAVENDFVPCLAAAARLWLDPQAVWLQYLPVALCCIWALFYFWLRRRAWDWLTNGSVLILVSLIAAPYSWLYDQCLAIPALLDAAFHTRSRNLLALLAFMILAADLELCLIKVSSPLWLWTVPAWFAWYLYARLPSGENTIRPPAI